jgi:hypothetical protein
MTKVRNILAIIALIALSGLVNAAEAQVAYRLTENEMKQLLNRIEHNADRFRDSLAKYLDVSRFDDTRAEDNINQFIKEFEAATDRLKSRFDDDQSAAGDVEEVLRRAIRIDGFMMRQGADTRARQDWMTLRQDLDQLATAYNVVWTWDGQARVYRLSDDQLRALLDRMEKEADTFRESLKDALEKTSFDGTNAEDDINAFVKYFEAATDSLEDRFGKKQSAASDAEEVLTRAARIDSFMQRHRLTVRAQEDWMRLRRSLDELSVAYGVNWRWV